MSTTPIIILLADFSSIVATTWRGKVMDLALHHHDNNSITSNERRTFKPSMQRISPTSIALLSAVDSDHTADVGLELGLLDRTWIR